MSREAGPRGKGKITNAESTSRTILNNGRVGGVISNNSSEKVLWLAFGETAVSEEGIKVEPKTTFTIPASYTGIVTGIGSPAITYAEF